MKNKKIIFFLFVSLIVSMQSCKEEKIDLYKQEAGVYFDPKIAETVYTFVENLNKIDVGYDYLNVPVMISGSAIDKDREFDVTFVKDSKFHTAEDGMLEMAKGIVKANSYGGYVQIKVNYSKKLDDSVYQAVLKILPSSDFPAVDLSERYFWVSFSNIFVQPENWYMIQEYFGNVYSNSWYKWVLKTLDCSSIPYKYRMGKDQEGITPEEAVRWPMRVEEIQSLSAKVKTALTKYNNDNPRNPMTHEDGDRKGELVVM